MLSRGNASKSKSQIAEEVAALGGSYGAQSRREGSFYWFDLQNQDVRRGISLLGEMVTTPTFQDNEVELAKEQISQEHEKNHLDYQNTLIENVHYNSFREHQIGQPKKGDRDNVQNLNSDMLREFYSANYYGDNTIVIGVGNINHDEFVQQVQDSFSSLHKEATAPTKNTEKAIYVPALLFIRDDEMYNSNVGVFYDAPSAKHPDFYSF